MHDISLSSFCSVHFAILVAVIFCLVVVAVSRDYLLRYSSFAIGVLLLL
jgi:hypothetical protein